MPQDVLEKVGGFGDKIKNIFYVYIIPIVVITNAYNIIWNTGTKNAEDIEYNNQAGKRRLNSAVQIAELKIALQREKDLRERDNLLNEIMKDFTKEIKRIDDRIDVFKFEELKEDIQEEKDKQ